MDGTLARDREERQAAVGDVQAVGTHRARRFSAARPVREVAELRVARDDDDRAEGVRRSARALELGLGLGLELEVVLGVVGLGLQWGWLVGGWVLGCARWPGECGGDHEARVELLLELLVAQLGFSEVDKLVHATTVTFPTDAVLSLGRDGGYRLWQAWRRAQLGDEAG